jgi:hypothetical protein
MELYSQQDPDEVLIVIMMSHLRAPRGYFRQTEGPQARQADSPRMSHTATDAGSGMIEVATLSGDASKKKTNSSLGASDSVMTVSGIEDADAQIAWASAYWRSGSLIDPRRASGFKTKWVGIADPRRFAQLVKARRARVIRMWRRNRVKTAVSLTAEHERHRVTGTRNRALGEPQCPPVYVDPAAFQGILQFTERH